MVERTQEGLKEIALVTGAGSGIGLELAKELAKRGYGLFLLALPGEGLPAVSRQISETFQVPVHCMEIDLTAGDGCQLVFEEAIRQRLEISILVNNAGIGSNGPFEDFSPEFYEKQVKLNVLVPVLLTRLFLPILRSKKQAFILNMGSLGGFFNIPSKEVYAASKAFILHFSNSLRLALSGSPVHILVVSPGPVDSNKRTAALNATLTGLARKSVMQSGEIAVAAIDALFIKKRQFIPGKTNRFLVFLSKWMPEGVKNRIITSKIGKQETSAAI
jgi:hypothetical protein